MQIKHLRYYFIFLFFTHSLAPNLSAQPYDDPAADKLIKQGIELHNLSERVWPIYQITEYLDTLALLDSIGHEVYEMGYKYNDCRLIGYGAFFIGGNFGLNIQREIDRDGVDRYSFVSSIEEYRCYLEQAQEQLKSCQSGYVVTEAHICLCNYIIYYSDKEKALTCYNNYLKSPPEDLNPVNEAFTYIQLGNFASDSLQNNTAFNYFHNALEIIDQIEETPVSQVVNSFATYNAARRLILLGLHTEAIPYLEEVVRIDRNSGIKINTLTSLILLYENLQYLENQEERLSEIDIEIGSLCDTLNCNKEANIQCSMYYAHNWSTVSDEITGHYLEGLFKMSIHNKDVDTTTFMFQDRAYDSAIAFEFASNTYQRLEDRSSEFEALQNFLFYSKRSKNIALLQKAHETFYKYYRASGDTSSAHYHEKHIQRLEPAAQIEKINLHRQVILTLTELNIAKRRKENTRLQTKLAEKESRNRKIQLITTGSSFLFILLALAFIINKFRKQKKLQSLEQEKQVLLDQLNAELLLKEEGWKKGLSDAKETIEHFRVTSQELIEEVESLDISKLEKKKLLREINEHLDNNVIDNLNLNYIQENEDFVFKLSIIAPNLTDKNIRRCILYKKKLKDKELAKILNVSESSLRVSRYRLKKKLGLSKDANLPHFLHTIDLADLNDLQRILESFS